MKQPLKINLQLFNEGAPEGGQAPTVSEQLGNIFDTAAAAQPDIQAQVGEQAPQGAETPQQETQPQEGQSQQPEQPPELILGKFKSMDEVLKSYKNQEAALTRAFSWIKRIWRERKPL